MSVKQFTILSNMQTPLDCVVLLLSKHENTSEDHLGRREKGLRSKQYVNFVESNQHRTHLARKESEAATTSKDLHIFN